jgi:hypothetical protein
MTKGKKVIWCHLSAQKSGTKHTLKTLATINNEKRVSNSKKLPDNFDEIM